MFVSVSRATQQSSCTHISPSLRNTLYGAAVVHAASDKAESMHTAIRRHCDGRWSHINSKSDNAVPCDAEARTLSYNIEGGGAIVRQRRQTSGCLRKHIHQQRWRCTYRPKVMWLACCCTVHVRIFKPTTTASHIGSEPLEETFGNVAEPAQAKPAVQ